MTASKSFMRKYHGKPCVVCSQPGGAHHILGRRVAPMLQEHPRNIMVLCGKHHTLDNHISAHGSHKAQREFDKFCKAKLGENYKDDLRALDRSLRNG